MANFDKQMADRVWKRVQGDREEEKQEMNLKGLILETRLAAETYRLLSRQLDRQEAQLLQRLVREEQANAACLKGVYRLTEGKGPEGKPLRLQPEPAEVLLRRAYAGELKRIAACEALSGHPEYGHIFAGMAAREREHSRLVLELLGRLEKRK